MTKQGKHTHVDTAISSRKSTQHDLYTVTKDHIWLPSALVKQGHSVLQLKRASCVQGWCEQSGVKTIQLRADNESAGSPS